MSEQKTKKHWPAIIVCVVSGLFFLISSVTFTAPNSEFVVVTRFGGFQRIAEKGLNFKWPYPVDAIVRIDSRQQHFERPLTQTALADVRNILVSVSAGWRVSDAEAFLKSVSSIEGAETVMKNIIGTPTGNVFPRYRLSEVFTTDEKSHKLDEIRAEILKGAQEIAGKYGIEITHVGFTQMAFAPSATASVLKRMRSERKVIAESMRNEGKENAEEIIRNAKRDAREKEVTASIEAEKIRRNADLEAAEIYQSFNDPKLVAFLRQLDSLKKVVNNKTQMVLDLNTPPFSILKGDFIEELKKQEETTN